MRWFWLASAMWALPAMAQDLDSTPDPAASMAAEDGAPKLGANIRFRSMSIPKGILNTWYFSGDEENALPFDRPKVGANVYGLEFAYDPAPASMIFYAEYWNVRMDEGYWDDIEEPADHNDGSWLKPSKLGMVAFGANFGHEIALSNAEANTWVGLRFGGGLGLAIPTGQIERWNSGANRTESASNGCQPDDIAPARVAGCDADEVLNLWPVFPVLDVDMALRVHINDLAVVRLDFGFHDMFFFGTAVGGTF